MKLFDKEITFSKKEIIWTIIITFVLMAGGSLFMNGMQYVDLSYINQTITLELKNGESFDFPIGATLFLSFIDLFWKAARNFILIGIGLHYGYKFGKREKRRKKK